MLSVSPGMLTAKALLKEDPEGGKAAFALEAQSSWVLLALLARYCSRNGVADQYCSAKLLSQYCSAALVPHIQEVGVTGGSDIAVTFMNGAI